MMSVQRSESDGQQQRSTGILRNTGIFSVSQERGDVSQDWV